MGVGGRAEKEWHNGRRLLSTFAEKQECAAPLFMHPYYFCGFNRKRTDWNVGMEGYAYTLEEVFMGSASVPLYVASVMLCRNVVLQYVWCCKCCQMRVSLLLRRMRAGVDEEIHYNTAILRSIPLTVFPYECPSTQLTT